MKRSIPSLYAEYGRYIDQFRAIPYFLDLLKPVERRILLALWETAKNKTVKSARVIGDVIGKYHPHGDQSAYGSLVSLVHRKLAIGQGNWGLSAYEITDPAAYRYTEAQSSSFVNTLCFEFIKQIPWSDPENLSIDQPDYLPSPIPIGLIGEGIIQGISFNTTKIPRYSFIDLISRLLGILEKKSNPQFIPPTIIPNMNNCDVFECSQGDFEKILTTGEGSIQIIPKMEVKNDGIYVYGRTPLGFTSLKNEEEKLERLNIDCSFKVIDLSAQNKIKVLIQPSSLKIFNQDWLNYIYKLLISTIHFSCKVVDPQNDVSLVSIDWLLEKCYLNWSYIYNLKLVQEQHLLQQQIYEYQIIAIVKELISNNKLQTMTDLINVYNSKYIQIYGANVDDIKNVCSKHRIQKLLEFNTDLTSTQLELNIINNLLLNIEQSAINKFQEIYLKLNK